MPLKSSLDRKIVAFCFAGPVLHLCAHVREHDLTNVNAVLGGQEERDGAKLMGKGRAQRSPFEVRCSTFILLLLSLAIPSYGLRNPPQPGNGCVEASTAEQLGAVEDRLTARTLVSIGVGADTPFLQTIDGLGTASPVESFLAAQDTPDHPLSNSFILLVNASGADPQELRDSPALSKAIAYSVPVVLENFNRDHIKALTGLGIEPQAGAVIVNSERGGRRVTISAIPIPDEGITPEFALNAVSRALANVGRVATADDLPRIYGLKRWDVWLHNGNVVCNPPYDPGQPMQKQLSNVDFGIEFTLVAGTDPQKKALDMRYLGAGFSPLTPIDNTSDRFKGAFTLELDYKGQLRAPEEASLSQDAVAPATAVNEHTVTKTTGWTVGVSSSCGGGPTGPACSITANFSYSSSKTETQTIPERVINATSSFGTAEADQGITYLLSSTATSDGGLPIDYVNNDWYGFFAHSTPTSLCWLAGAWTDDPNCTDDGGVLYDGKEKWPSDNQPTVKQWPNWAQNSANTEGEASYSMDHKFRGPLTYNASFKATEGVFALGAGPYNQRNADFTGLFWGPWYRMNLYTDSYSKSIPVTVDANAVNYSGMPTCALKGYSQADVGIWAVQNTTNYATAIGQLTALPLTPDHLIPTKPYDYAGSASYLAGVSAISIGPGQEQYVALCSANQNETGVAISLLYDNGNGTKGSLDFTGSGAYHLVNGSPADPHIKVDKDARLITISESTPAPTTTTLESVPTNSLIYGQPASFKATVSPSTATGMVAFLDGTETLGSASLENGTATYTTSSLAGGAHALTASYGGNDLLSTSKSNTLNQTITPAQPVVAVMSDGSPSRSGNPVTFTATVTSAVGIPQGTVAFLDGGNPIGEVKLNGAGTALLPISSLGLGSHQITARYNGSQNYVPATSEPMTQVVKQPTASTTTTLAISQNPSVTGQTIYLQVQVQAASGSNMPTGTVTFVDNNTTIGTGKLANGQATLSVSNLAFGSHVIGAAYGGDNNFAASSARSTQTVLYATEATIVPDHNPSSVGQPVNFTVTISANGGGVPTGNITLSQETQVFGSATLRGGVGVIPVSTFKAGTYQLRVTYGGDPVHASLTSQAITQVVNGVGEGPPTSLASISITLLPNGNRSGLTVPVLLIVKNNGTVPASNISIESVLLRALAGRGEATVESPALPIVLSALMPGASTSVDLQLAVPSTIQKLEIIESGSIGITGSAPGKFSLGQILFPNQ